MAGCVPVDRRNRRVLLVASSKHDGEWVLPKGGWENDETQEEAAARETWEEGIYKHSSQNLNALRLKKKKKKKTTGEEGLFFQAK